MCSNLAGLSWLDIKHATCFICPTRENFCAILKTADVCELRIGWLQKRVPYSNIHSKLALRVRTWLFPKSTSIIYSQTSLRVAHLRLPIGAHLINSNIIIPASCRKKVCLRTPRKAWYRIWRRVSNFYVLQAIRVLSGCSSNSGTAARVEEGHNDHERWERIQWLHRRS